MTCALDLVKYIRKEHGEFFHISVAGYPEGHPNVIKKVEEGRVLTEAERKRVVTLEDGEHVCGDADYANEIAYLKKKVRGVSRLPPGVPPPPPVADPSPRTHAYPPPRPLPTRRRRSTLARR